MFKKRSIWRLPIIFLLVSLTLLVLTACVPGDGSATPARPADFLWGIWHGWIAPISLIIGIFNRNIHIYENINNGWWYDLGYYMAIISGFGGLSLGRRSRRSREEKGDGYGA
ncbi:MAG: hypothetical protein PHC86_00125 [Eubacteriales bacterium]|nr:hypothetical protein [Eubacteriales bacterium]